MLVTMSGKLLLGLSTEEGIWSSAWQRHDPSPPSELQGPTNLDSSREKNAKPIILWSTNLPINALWKRDCSEHPSEGNHAAVKYIGVIGEGSKRKKWKVKNRSHGHCNAQGRAYLLEGAGAAGAWPLMGSNLASRWQPGKLSGDNMK